MHTEIVLNLLLATLIGAAIGLERQWRQRFIGLSTNALVALGAASFTSLSLLFTDDASPTRMAAQVVSGIGFLGAGVIMREGLNVRGLNTAATLWCSAAVGSLAGAGLFLLALAGAFGVIATNTVLRPLTRALLRTRERASTESDEYTFEVVAGEKSEHIVRGLLVQSIANADMTLRAITASKSRQESVTLRAELAAPPGARVDVLERIVQRLGLDPKVRSVRWWNETGEEDA